MESMLNIKDAARKRGFTLSSLAKKLGMARSNMSAISSGARGISIDKLKKITDILYCGIDELDTRKEYPMFKNKQIEVNLRLVEERNYDGIDKSWVSRLMYIHNAHYKIGCRDKV